MYMVAIHIDYIHGDHLVRPHQTPVHDLAERVDPSAVTAGLSGVRSVHLSWVLDAPVYIVDAEDGPLLFDARTGARRAPIDEPTVRALARHWYAGDGEITRVALLDTSPLEVQARPAPLWRVDFEGWSKPSFYFSPTTGEFLSRRHEACRVFDFMWMLHIMDYDDRQNMNNPLLRVMTWGAVLMALSGAWLLLYSFPRRKRSKKAAA